MRHSIELPLTTPIDINDSSVSTIKIRKMVKSDVFAIAGDGELSDSEAVVKFVERCGVGQSDGGDIGLNAEAIRDLHISDGLQLQMILGHMVSRDGSGVSGGDSIDAPISYTLVKPLKFMGKKVSKLNFMARKFGDFIDVEDAETPEKSFDEFVRKFASLDGVELAITDGFINSLDCRDIFAIRGEVMGKLVNTSPRWKEV